MRKITKTSKNKMKEFITACDKSTGRHCVVVLLFKSRLNSERCSVFVSESISDKRSGYV